MADMQFNPGQPSGFRSGDQRSPEARDTGPQPPPQAKVDIRTMASDIKSIGTGERMPIPESVMAPDAEKEMMFSPETKNQMGGMVAPEEGGSKKLVLWISVIVGIVALGLVGYFVVYPILFPSAPPPPPPAPPTPPPATVAPHASYFVTPAAATDKILLGDLSFLTLSQKMQNEVFVTPASDGDLKEVEIADANGDQVPFRSYLPVVLGGFDASTLGNTFEDDFTAFVYFDGNGEWPGYIAKAQASVTADAFRAALQPLESADLANMFITSPGASQGGFKDGSINGAPGRYIVFPGKAGAAFNYAILDRYVLMSTSYAGAQKAATLLGF